MFKKNAEKFIWIVCDDRLSIWFIIQVLKQQACFNISFKSAFCRQKDIKSNLTSRISIKSHKKGQHHQKRPDHPITKISYKKNLKRKCIFLILCLFWVFLKFRELNFIKIAFLWGKRLKPKINHLGLFHV